LIAVANTKITELTQLTNPVSTDVLPIVDVGADVTKKISIADLLKNAAVGTAEAPGIAFDGDSNTGIYSPGADQVAISTNGTGRLFVGSNGRVGIGTASPSTLLHLDTLNETTAITVAAITSTGGQLHLGIGGKSSGFQSIVATGNGLDIGTTLGAPITFFTNGTVNERARIDADGRLLVGMSSASGGALLQVNGDRVRVATAKTPASASDTGTTGEICWDANYIYVCTATNTWKRTAIATW
jgi:hypothetical protein